MRVAAILPLIVGLSVAACGNSGSGSASGGPPPGSDSLAVDTGSFTVPAGDSLTCIYTDTTTTTDIYVGNATGHQGPGGHHILLYYTDVPMAPTHHTCTDEEMLSWHQIAGADTNKEPVIAIPAGAAVKVPAGKQLVVQSHYINTTGSPQMVDDTMNVQLLQQQDIVQLLNFFALVDLGFNIPPQSTYKSITTCTVTNDLKSVSLLGHMHEFGQHFTLEEVDSLGNSLSTVYDTAWQPQYMTHPPIMANTLDAPTLFKAGTIFRQTCEWNNTTATAMAFPTEMCVSFMFYFPDQGFIECDGKPAM